MKLSRSVFVEPTRAHLDVLGLIPSGTDQGGDSVPGPRPGTVWNTTARLSIPSLRTGIMPHVHEHVSNSNPTAKDAVEALVLAVVLPRAALEDPYRSNPDLFEAPTSVHLDAMEVHNPTRADQVRLFVRGRFKSLAAGVPDTVFQFSVEPPAEALASLLVIADTFVLPAVVAEVME